LNPGTLSNHIHTRDLIQQQDHPLQPHIQTNATSHIATTKKPLNFKMVSSSYRITEPHPSVSSSHYIHAGRGGAGNVTHIDPKAVTSAATATGPASRTNLTHPSSGYYASGRGGVGNMHHTGERPIFSFDEELERQRRMMEHQTPVYHVGRGGAGNFANEGEARRTSSTSETSSVASSQGVRNSLEGTWNRLRGSFAASK